MVGGLIEAKIDSVCRRFGISHAALNAMAVIEGEAEPMLTGEVAARMHITSGTITSLLDNLERKGYVTRTSDPDDRRRVLVDVTADAQAVLDELLPAIQQVSQLLFDKITQDRQRALLEILDDVRTALAAVPDDLPRSAPRRRPPRLTR